MAEKALTELGLSVREIEVYKALLKIGATTSGPIVKNSKVSNSKIYETLNKLIEKGLVTYIFKGKIKYFQATSPRNLLNIYESNKFLLQETVKDLEKSIKQDSIEQSAVVYEGTKAIKSVFFEMYDYIGKKNEYCAFPLGEQLASPELIQFWAEVFNKRIQMNITVRSLPNKKWKDIFEKSYHHYQGLKIRYTNIHFPTGIFIFKDHVLTVIWKEEPIAFLIKSRENYVRWQKFFDEQWNSPN